jgi:hypothetical protein
MDYTVKTISINSAVDWGMRRAFLCHADIDFPDMRLLLKSCGLYYYPSEGFIRLFPPDVRRATAAALIHWDTNGPLQKEIAADVLSKYIAMGGVAPPAARKPDAIDAVMDAVEAELAANPGKRLSEASADVYERGDWKEFKAAAFAECDRAVENAKRKGKPVPVRSVEQIDAQMSDVPDISEMGLSRPETAGLARTLGVAL